MTSNKENVGPPMGTGSAERQHDTPVSIAKSRTFAWHQIPEWQRDNHYILSGYRPVSGSFKKSFASLIHQHNESFNAWSHLLGAVTFAVIGVRILGRSLITADHDDVLKEDVYLFACFFLGAVGCLGMSGVYHTLSNCSKEVAAFGNKLDYLGWWCLSPKLLGIVHLSKSQQQV